MLYRSTCEVEGAKREKLQLYQVCSAQLPAGLVLFSPSESWNCPIVSMKLLLLPWGVVFLLNISPFDILLITARILH